MPPRRLLALGCCSAALLASATTAQAATPTLTVASVQAYSTFASVAVDVDPKGCATHQQLFYGTSSNYTGSDDALYESSGQPHRHNGGFQNLTPGTLYHFTLSVSNNEGCFGGGVTQVTAGDHCFVTPGSNDQGPGGEVACPATGGGTGGGGTAPPASFATPAQVTTALQLDAPALASLLSPSFASLISDKGVGLISDKGVGFAANAPAAGLYGISVAGVVSTGGNGLLGSASASLAKKKRRPKPVILAKGQTYFPAAGNGTVAVRLTKKGKAAMKKVRIRRKKLLRQGKRVRLGKLTLKLSFTQPGQKPVSVKRRFKIKAKKR
jgi:hypothetical protein